MGFGKNLLLHFQEEKKPQGLNRNILIKKESGNGL